MNAFALAPAATPVADEGKLTALTLGDVADDGVSVRGQASGDTTHPGGAGGADVQCRLMVDQLSSVDP
jgi:hypothetical protein